MVEKRSDIIQAISPVVKAFEHLGIPYYIGGSIASSAYGIARSTMDVDMVSSLLLSKVKSFVALLENDYYIDEGMILTAINNKSSFNVVHLKTMIKVDVFIPKQTPFNQRVLERKVKDTIVEEGCKIEVYFESPEDVIINKLCWFRMGGEVSERQLSDILGILKVQKKLDFEYLKYWAKELSLSDLLEKILEQASS